MKTIKAQQLGQSLLLYFFQRVARVIRHVSGILLFEVRSGKLSKRAFDDTVRPLQYLSISQSKKAYQLENQLDIGDYDVRALLIRPQKSEEARSTGEPYGYSEGFGH
ncbi:hypothetical protein HZH68_012248 [Vespula germanica]|uniref:Uncharacterized protein n=1 Tax=Vespula germanica TaxID=30212 RepID=A0A834JMX1_VESGE|nr:hypothetical protein HZH68_012248 [Vespula germanica]